MVLAVRDTEKGDLAAARIAGTVPEARLAVLRLDLSDLGSVRAAAERLRSAHERIDILVNNAGVMYPPYSRTQDGFELQFGTNHLGHFALTGLLLDRLLASERSRVVTMSSMGHRFRARINFEDLQSERRYSRVAAYGQSKLANIMFTYELQRRLAGTGTVAVAAHPGVSDTELPRHTPAPIRALGRVMPALRLMQPAEMGALPALRAATDPDVSGGEYFGPRGVGGIRGYPVRARSSAASLDVEGQRRLWECSERLTGVRYPV